MILTYLTKLFKKRLSFDGNLALSIIKFLKETL